MKEAIKKAVDIAGGQKNLAIAIGVTSQAVNQWVHTGKTPANRVISIEKFLKRRVTRYELRPDLYPSD